MAIELDPKLFGPQSSSTGGGSGVIGSAAKMAWKPVSKVFDVLNTGSYAVGGLLSGRGARAGIQQKINPAKALNIENPILGFVVDVGLDPLTYLGGLGVVKGAAQKGATKVLAREAFQTQLRQNMDTALGIPAQVRQARREIGSSLRATKDVIKEAAVQNRNVLKAEFGNIGAKIGDEAAESIDKVRRSRELYVQEAKDKFRSNTINERNAIEGPLSRKELVQMTINERKAADEMIESLFSAEKNKLNEKFVTDLKEAVDDATARKINIGHKKELKALEKDFSEFKNIMMKEVQDAMTLSYKQNTAWAKARQAEIKIDLSDEIARIKSGADQEIQALRLASSTAKAEQKAKYAQEVLEVKRRASLQLKEAQANAANTYQGIKSQLITRQQEAFAKASSTVKDSMGLVEAARVGSDYAATLSARGRLGQTGLITASIPFTNKGIVVAKGQWALDGLTKLGEAFRSTKIGKGLRSTFNAPTLTAADYGLEATLENLERMRNIERTTKRLRLTAEGAKVSAQRTAEMVRGRYEREISDLKLAGKINEEDIRNLTQNLNDELAGLGAKLEVPEELRPMYDSMLSLAQKEYAERVKLMPEFADKAKGLTYIVNKAWREANDTSDPTFITNISRRFKEDPSTFFSRHFKLGDDLVLANAKGNKAQGITSGAKYIRVGDKWIEGSVPGNANIKEAIAKLNRHLDSTETRSVIRSYDDMVREDILGGLKLSEAEQLRLDEILKLEGLQRDLTASPIEFNRAYRDAGETMDIFEESPTKILAQIIENTGVSRANSIIQSELSALSLPPGIPKTMLPKGFKTIEGIPELKGYSMPEDVANYIGKVYTANTSIKELETIRKYYDGVNNATKALLTVFNPAFIARNILGNGFQLYNADVNPLRATEAAYVAAQLFKKVPKIAEGGGRLSLTTALDATSKLKGRHQKLFKEFIEEGGLGTNFYRELDDTGFIKTAENMAQAGAEKLAEKGMTGTAKALSLSRSGLSNTTNFLGKAAELGDVWARYATFLDRKAKGYTTADALSDVRRYFFDYGDLSPVEKQVFKRLAPFYTWSRNNIPLQVALLWEKPGKLASVEKVRNSIETYFGKDDDEDNFEMLPEWLRDSFPTYVGDGENGLKRYVRMQGIMPSLDLMQLESKDNLTEFGLGSITPLFKVPFEAAINYNSYFQKPLSSFEGEKVEGPFGVMMSPRTKHFVNVVRPIMEWDRLLNEEGSMADRLLRFGMGVNVTSIDPEKVEAGYALDLKRESSAVKSAMNKIQDKIDEGIATDRDRRELDRLQGIYDALPEKYGMEDE